jgi:NADPH:quinone reductase-like Zn-dependent oxidoreductase
VDLKSSKIIEEDIRDPGANEVRIRILASGVAFADVLMRRGLYSGVPPLPYSIVGVVDCVGAEVSQWKPGDFVAALIQTGGYSRLIVLPASELVRVPVGLDPAEAVSLVLNYTTAYQLIHRIAKLSQGEKVLIPPGSGACSSISGARFRQRVDSADVPGMIDAENTSVCVLCIPY